MKKAILSPAEASFYPCNIVEISVQSGRSVKKGDILAVFAATTGNTTKSLRAPFDGDVADVFCIVGQRLASRERILAITVAQEKPAPTAPPTSAPEPDKPPAPNPKPMPENLQAAQDVFDETRNPPKKRSRKLGLGVMLIVGLAGLFGYAAGTGQLPNLNGKSIAECDAFAGHRLDETLEGPGVAFGRLVDHKGDAIAACLTASKSGQGRQYFQLGRAYLADGQNELGVSFYEKARDKGHITAKYWLAEFHRRGRYGVEKNPVLGLKMHKENAAAGYIPSVFDAGVLSQKNFGGLSTNYAVSYRYLLRANGAEYGPSYYELARLYQKGLGVEKNNSRAIALYRDALEKSTYQTDNTRKNLALTMLDQQSWYYDYVPVRLTSQSQENRLATRLAAAKDQITSALELLKSRLRDGDPKTYEDYLRALMPITASWLFDFGKAGDGRFQMNPAVQGFEINVLREMQQAIFMGLRAENPDKTSQTDVSGYMLSTVFRMKSFVEGRREMDDRLATLRQFIEWKEPRVAKGEKPRDCIDRTGSWADGVYKISLKNQCSHDVIVDIQLKITYKSNYAPQTKATRNKVISPGMTARFSLRSNHSGGGATGSTPMGVCYKADGFEKAPTFLAGGTYKCGSASKKYRDLLAEYNEVLDGMGK